jgi:hypothetical protein
MKRKVIRRFRRWHRFEGNWPLGCGGGWWWSAAGLRLGRTRVADDSWIRAHAAAFLNLCNLRNLWIDRLLFPPDPRVSVFIRGSLFLLLAFYVFLRVLCGESVCFFSGLWLSGAASGRRMP